jgi:hypothetical protein
MPLANAASDIEPCKLLRSKITYVEGSRSPQKKPAAAREAAGRGKIGAISYPNVRATQRRPLCAGSTARVLSRDGGASDPRG